MAEFDLSGFKVSILPCAPTCPFGLQCGQEVNDQEKESKEVDCGKTILDSSGGGKVQGYRTLPGVVAIYDKTVNSNLIGYAVNGIRYLKPQF